MMTDRIKELAEQARKNEPFDCSQMSKQQWLQTFAEMVVRECLSIVENNNPRPPGTTILYSFVTDEYFDTGWQVAVETKSKQIKQHFGVE